MFDHKAWPLSLGLPGLAMPTDAEAIVGRCIWQQAKTPRIGQIGSDSTPIQNKRCWKVNESVYCFAFLYQHTSGIIVVRTISQRAVDLTIVHFQNLDDPPGLYAIADANPTKYPIKINYNIAVFPHWTSCLWCRKIIRAVNILMRYKNRHLPPLQPPYLDRSTLFIPILTPWVWPHIYMSFLQVPRGSQVFSTCSYLDLSCLTRRHQLLRTARSAIVQPLKTSILEEILPYHLRLPWLQKRSASYGGRWTWGLCLSFRWCTFCHLWTEVHTYSARPTTRTDPWIAQATSV